MKKLTTALAALLLISLAMGIMFGSAGGLLLAQPAKAAFEVEIPFIPFPDIPIVIPTPTPKPQIVITLAPDFNFLTLAPQTITPDKTTTKPTPKPTNKPSSGGGQLMNNEGPLFLSFQAELTKKLLMFTPMDLSVDGETTIPLIGNEKQVVGEAKLTVQSGMVIVSYLVIDGVKVDEKNEFFTFFPDIRSVPWVEPRKLQDVKLTFGVPYNIASWLGSDPKVLLYINTPVSYKNNLPGLTPFSIKDEAYLQRMMASLPLMD